MCVEKVYTVDGDRFGYVDIYRTKTKVNIPLNVNTLRNRVGAHDTCADKLFKTSKLMINDLTFTNSLVTNSVDHGV